MDLKICQNCAKEFPVGSEDVSFYEKIKVPVPTFCPECRVIRRMNWRNERALYKRKDDAPGAVGEMISMYAPDAPYVVYDKEYWWSDKWDPLSCGVEYDFSKPFFEQCAELLKRVPLPALSTLNSTNSPYTNYVDGNNNCYLIFGSGWNENVRYSNKVFSTKDSQDLLMNSHNELCYECVNCQDSYYLLYSKNCRSCTDSYFLYDCRGCVNCFACANLNNKSYCFFNEQLSREEYFKRIGEFNMGKRSVVTELKKRFQKEIYEKALHRYASITNSVNCTGDNITNSKNCQYCFDIYENAEDSKYQFSSLNIKDSYDGNGVHKMELGYELLDCNVGMQNLSCITVYSSNNCSYSFTCQASSNLFGCIGLRSKEYCILNKQYSKEDYFALVEKIKEQMLQMPYKDPKGRTYIYGDFFPASIAPWAYNETIADEYFPLTKEEITSHGYVWRDREESHHTITIQGNVLPDDIADVSDSILNETIGCAESGRAFKLIADELNFYKRLHVPLPAYHSDVRHMRRIRERNPLRLWKCVTEDGKEVLTSFPPDSPEKIVSDEEYKKRVY